MSDLKSFYEAVKKDVKPEALHLGDRLFTTAPVHPVRLSEPEPLFIQTLSGLVDYLKANVDDLDLASLLVIIKSPTRIEVCGSLTGDFAQRSTIMVVDANVPAQFFETPMNSETFNIWLQSGFADSEDREKVLVYSSNVVVTAEAGVTDNGTSQAVTVRTGITSKALAVLPNPVSLAPYRTFSEVEQPVSKFVFRVHDGPKFSLWEADGGAWKHAAIQAVYHRLYDLFDDHGIPSTIIA